MWGAALGASQAGKGYGAQPGVHTGSHQAGCSVLAAGRGVPRHLGSLFGGDNKKPGFSVMGGGEGHLGSLVGGEKEGGVSLGWQEACEGARVGCMGGGSPGSGLCVLCKGAGGSRHLGSVLGWGGSSGHLGSVCWGEGGQGVWEALQQGSHQADRGVMGVTEDQCLGRVYVGRVEGHRDPARLARSYGEHRGPWCQDRVYIGGQGGYGGHWGMVLGQCIWGSGGHSHQAGRGIMEGKGDYGAGAECIGVGDL